MIFGDAPPQRRRLAQRLRELRLRAGLTGEQLARVIDRTQSTVSRVELADQAPAPELVGRWCAACGATADELRELLELSEAVASEVMEWRRALRQGLPRLQQELIGLESRATAITNFNPVQIPGLLQTADYARRVFTAMNPEGRPDIPEAVAARMERQTVLYDDSKSLNFILTEQALRWRTAPPTVLLAQLDRLMEVGRQGHVMLGVIPADREITMWHSHGFNLFEFDDRPPLIQVETRTSALTLTDERDIETYRAAFVSLREFAVMGDEVTALIRAIMADLLHLR